MLRLTSLFVVMAALSLTSCGLEPASPPVPPAIVPVLDGWRQAGLSCGDPTVGMPDNAPQWTCLARLHDVALTVTFMGDDAGVMDFEADVPAGTDPATAIAAFTDVVSAMRAFPAARTGIVTWIHRWNGSAGQVSTGFAGTRVTIASDATWISLVVARVPRFVAPSPDPLPVMSSPLPNQAAV
jgi:hypothetical protein